MYRVVDAAVVRTASCPVVSAGSDWPELDGNTDEDVEAWRDWLRQVWTQEDFVAAVEVGSPVLASQVRDVCAGRRLPPKRARRVVLSVIRYLVRSGSRATPFGLFAGVAPARFGTEPTVHVGQNDRAVARVDAQWLSELIAWLESYPELLRRLPVVVNNLAFVRDGRLVIAHHQQRDTTSQPAEVSVRHSKAVAVALQFAASPLRFDDLLQKLTCEFPAASDVMIRGMLSELVRHSILLTSLRPPMTITDPIAHVLAELNAAEIHTVAQVGSVVNQLSALQAELCEHDRSSSPTAARAIRDSATTRMTALAATDRPLGVDVRSDVTLALPNSVRRGAERAAALLTRLTPRPFGSPSWQEYHTRFLERYGIGALVPMQDLVDPDTGLGFPAGYRGSLLEPPAQEVTDRDRTLLAIAQNAARDGKVEVNLDERMIAELSARNFDAGRVQPHSELLVRLHAPSLDAVARGAFDLVVVGVPRAAGTTAGRFLDLLPPADRERMAAEYRKLPRLNADAVLAQVSCPPLFPRTANVVRSVKLLPHTISLTEHRGSDTDVLPLNDLAVGANVERLYLWSLSRQRPVEATVFSAVEMTNFAHPLVRFLCEIGKARTAACGAFSWGAADRLPFLPRLRHGRTILSPARWILPSAELPPATAPWSVWRTKLADWRQRTNAPRVVFVGDNDRRLRLDLDEPAHLHLLRTEMDRSGQATLREAPSEHDLGWIRGRMHEIVVPLAATRTPALVSPQAQPCSKSVVRRDDGHVPGASEWVYVKLYGHPDRHSQILGHLPTLLSQWDEPVEWWFLPYQDPAPHLRLRFHLPKRHALGPALQDVGAWARDLRQLGLASQVQLDTYYPETGRFGTGKAMTSAETVFAADSAAAIAQRAHSDHPESVPVHALLAASLVDIAISFMGSAERGMACLTEHIPTNPVVALPRETHDQAMLLTNPHAEWSGIRALPEGESITAAWSRRCDAIRTYSDTITASGEIEPGSALSSLLHLHSIRMAGIDPDAERACLRLARAAALSWTTRAQATA